MAPPSLTTMMDDDMMSESQAALFSQHRLAAIPADIVSLHIAKSAQALRMVLGKPPKLAGFRLVFAPFRLQHHARCP